MPVIARGMPAKPLTGSAALCTAGSALMWLTWTGSRPDCREQRLGLQNLYWYALSSSTPAATSAFMCGVCTSVRSSTERCQPAFAHP